VYPHDNTVKSTFKMEIRCKHLDWQVTSAAQISHALRTVFSPVESLTIKFSELPISSEMDNEANHTQWCNLLGSFSNVKTLRVHDDFCRQISCSLQVEDGETPIEILSKLKVLECQAPNGSENLITCSLMPTRMQATPSPLSVLLDSALLGPRQL
jgi:hypothetical protein